MTVEVLRTGENWTPQQALSACLSIADTMESVAISYVVKDTDGLTCVQSSDVDSREMLWLGNAITMLAMEP